MFDSEKKLNILCISPHPDDIEFGCGGTIHKLIKMGHNVSCMAMSNCENSLIHNTNKDLIDELKNSCEVLGIKDIKTFDFEVRNLWKSRTEINNILYNTNQLIKPDVIFAPSSSDIHQDHKVINECATTIFKISTLFGYELPWNCFNFSPDMYIKLSREDVDKKIEAISKYKTQSKKIYSAPEYTESTMRFRGYQVHAEYAEAFEVIKLVV